MTYDRLAGIGFPRHDPGEFELEEGDLAAGVDHGVVDVVGAEDQVVPVHRATSWKTAVTNIAFFNLGCMILPWNPMNLTSLSTFPGCMDRAGRPSRRFAWSLRWPRCRCCTR